VLEPLKSITSDVMRMSDHLLPLPIITPRLVIRDPARTDMRGWSAIYRSPRVRRYMNGPLTRTTKGWWAGNQRLGADVDRPLSIVFPETDELVGVCGFLKSAQPGEWEVWILLRSKYWGKAIGAEVTSALIKVALSSLGAKRVIGIIDPENQGSLSMITRLGFSFLREYSGTLRWQQEHHIYGVERHTHIPAVLRTLRDQTAQRR
jgi:[ribosomal protein S5]-alanine N-acetyltransferase